MTTVETSAVTDTLKDFLGTFAMVMWDILIRGVPVDQRINQPLDVPLDKGCSESRDDSVLSAILKGELMMKLSI